MRPSCRTPEGAAARRHTGAVPAVTVRAARAGDLTGLLDLYRELADDRPSARPAAEPAAAGLLEEILRNPARTILVAEAGGRLAGTADLLVVTNLTHGGQPWAIVENVVVAAAARGQGVGTALMRRAAELARQAGCYKIQLLSRRQRVDAHRFYRGLGFESSAEGFRIYFAD
jgi:GNAT superfamily N-acetyltransferase